MIYCNCHYRYKDNLCEVVDLLPNAIDRVKRAKIRLQNGSEIICPESDLKEIPLTKSILQSCYRMKTIVRNGEWDVLWDLGGKNNVAVGEKGERFYLIPFQNIETVVEVLPRGFVQGHTVTGLKEPFLFNNLSDLERIFPEIVEYIRVGKVKVRTI